MLQNQIPRDLASQGCARAAGLSGEFESASGEREPLRSTPPSRFQQWPVACCRPPTGRAGWSYAASAGWPEKWGFCSILKSLPTSEVRGTHCHWEPGLAWQPRLTITMHVPSLAAIPDNSCNSALEYCLSHVLPEGGLLLLFQACSPSVSVGALFTQYFSSFHIHT